MKPKATAIITLVCTALVGILALFVSPREGQAGDSSYFGLFLSLSSMVTVLYSGSALLFLKGLQSFKTRLRLVYGFMCVGFVVFGLAQIQTPLVQLFPHQLTRWAFSGGVLLPFMVGLFFIYGGTRGFAKIFNIKNIFMSWWFAIGSSAAFSCLGLLLPYVPSVRSSEMAMKGSYVFILFGLCFTLYTGILTLLAKRAASTIYTNALAWLVLTHMTGVLAGFAYLIPAPLYGTEHWTVMAGLFIVPYIFAGGMLLRAAYDFNILNDRQVPSADRYTFFGKPIHAKTGQTFTSIDIVMFAASQVSNPREIDAIMDEVRFITSRLGATGSLTPADEEKLKQVYLDIENYLVQREPIRKFTAENLRRKISEHFSIGTSSASSTFWASLY